MGSALDRVILIVLDSCCCGAAPDAAQYGDAGADTLGNLSRGSAGSRCRTSSGSGSAI